MISASLANKSSSYKELVPVSSATFIFYCLFVIEFFFRSSSRIEFIGVFRPTLILVLIISVLLLSQKNILKKREVNSVSMAINGLLIYLLLSLPFVTFPGSVITQNLSDFIRAIVFFFFTAMIIDTPGRLKKFLIIFITLQLIRVLEPLYLNISSGYWGDKTYTGDGEFANRLAGAPSDVINPNELGFVIVTIIPFLHFLLLPRGWLKKVLYLGLMAALLYALILTMSRGAFLALLVVAFIVFKGSNNKAALILVGFIAASAGWSVMSPVQQDRYLSLISDDTQASKGVDGRFSGMVREFELGLRRPIFGHGLGTTPEAKYNFTGKRQASHNLYAELLIEIGLIGMILFLRVLYQIYKNLKKLNLSISNNNIESQRLLKVMVTIFFMYLVYSSNYWGLSQSYWYLFAGLTVAIIQITQSQQGQDLYESKD